jgi:hypothetical protein
LTAHQKSLRCSKAFRHSEANIRTPQACKFTSLCFTFTLAFSWGSEAMRNLVLSAFIIATLSTPAVGATSSAPVAPTTPICSGRTLFGDNFTAFDPSWGTPNNNASIAPLSAGGPSMNISAPTEGGYLLQNTKTFPNNVDICVMAGDIATSSPLEMGGVVFWESSPNDLYYFVTTVGGNIALLRLVAGQWTTIVKLHPEPTLHTGANVFNQINLRLFGDQGIVGINGKLIGGFTGVPPASGRGGVGLLIETSKAGPATWAFQNYSVMDPMMH